ncbi:hypothetical protein [Siphonobacter aquaeclarae]|uniref:Chain length determinant protein n=1 Tax=Siphonobacter aquaeclarae TaxID=563176 RepID=A0A1G9K6T2_9BACT|nr:hypothetical protein [Siphonobacter aquaeclarae]SDL45590.1 hypothetical protein SAMN04488090_0907 [Siphonobacter aquaeclarae]
MVSENPKPVLTPNGEIATQEAAPPFDPRKVIQSIKGVFKILIRYWWLLVVLGVLGGFLGWLYDQVNATPDQYQAKIVFNLESGGGMSNEMSTLASAFGMGGAATSADMFSGPNFLALFRSKKIGNRVMMTPITWNGRTDLLANFYKNRSGALRRTKNEEYLGRKFRFPNKPLKEYSTVEVSYLNMFRDYAAADLSIDNVDKKSSFMELKTKTDSDTLSKILVETWLQKMTEFYREARNQKTMELLTLYVNRRDSVLTKLSGAERKLAASQDMSQYVVMPSGRVSEQRLLQNTNYLQGLYMDAIRNIDALRTSLIKDSPLVTIIDEPTYPIDSVPYPYGRAMKIGIGLGIILALISMFLINTYQNMMKKLKA